MSNDEPEIWAPIRPDRPDDRDIEFAPTRASDGPPARFGPALYQRYVRETWHQRGEECTGFALAAIANYHLRRSLDDPTAQSVSRRMLYESAQLHDDADFDEGSTLRGALKGWQRTGVAIDELWPYAPGDEFGERHGVLTLGRLCDPRHRPLLRYRRILHDDVVRMQEALAAGQPLFAGARLHAGWYRLFMPEAQPIVEQRPDDDAKGGHAFVIVGYDEHGFWIHNSWGPEWGNEGYALLPYGDWAGNGYDTWVVDVAPPTEHAIGSDRALAPTLGEVSAYRDLWPHLVVLDDDGRLVSEGLYEMDEGSLKTLLFLFQERTATWANRRLMVVSDAGYRKTPEAIDHYRHVRDRCMAQEIYPIFVVGSTTGSMTSPMISTAGSHD